MSLKIMKLSVINFVCVLFFFTACDQIPMPFQPTSGAAVNPLVKEGAARGIWVQPLDGVSKPMSKLLANAIVEGFRLRGIRATTNPYSNSRYHLKGKANINNNDFSQPYVALITWTLFDYSGNPQGTKVMGVPGSLSDWNFGSPVTLAAIGKAASNIISTMINSIQRTENSVKKPELLGIWINQVTNAPGDGNESLTIAIKKIIQGDGVMLAKGPQLAEFFLDGNVYVGLSKNGLQQVEIVWKLSTPDNNEVGQVTQNNVVKSGMFSNTWGDVSSIIAEAALEGIRGLLKHVVSSKFIIETPERELNLIYPSASQKLVLPPPSLDLEGIK